MARFGDRIAIGVTLNEPDLPEMLSWAGLPPQTCEIERATLRGGEAAAGVQRYRASNVMQREDFAACARG